MFKPLARLKLKSSPSPYGNCLLLERQRIVDLILFKRISLFDFQKVPFYLGLTDGEKAMRTRRLNILILFPASDRAYRHRVP
jgi:hypothetical protein